MYLKIKTTYQKKCSPYIAKTIKKVKKIKTIQTKIKPNSEKRKGEKKTTQKNLK